MGSIDQVNEILARRTPGAASLAIGRLINEGVAKGFQAGWDACYKALNEETDRVVEKVIGHRCRGPKGGPLTVDDQEADRLIDCPKEEAN